MERRVDNRPAWMAQEAAPSAPLDGDGASSAPPPKRPRIEDEAEAEEARRMERIAARAEARAADDDALRVLEKLKALDVDLTQVLCTQQAAAGPSAKEPGAAASPVQAALGRAASALGAPPKSEG